MTKTCSRCQRDWDDSFFLKGRAVCKDCRSEKGKEMYVQRKDELSMLEGSKECVTCKQLKDVQLFRAGKNSCNDCQNQKRRENRANKADPTFSESIAVVCPPGYKFCKVCHVVKKDDLFRKDRQKCKKCENVERVAYKKGEIQKQPQSSFAKEEDDFARQLKMACRFRIRDTVPKDIAKKLTEENRFGYVCDFLGCDMNFLKRWLQYNYTSEMTDQNYGTFWYMDHVLPIHTFQIKTNFEENKKFCYSWFNISPLKPLENSCKAIGIDKKQLLIHKNHLLQFCAENGIQPDENYLLLCAKHLDAGNPLESSTTTSL